MENLICHSGMLIGSLLALLFGAASIGGFGLLSASFLRRTFRKSAG